MDKNVETLASIASRILNTACFGLEDHDDVVALNIAIGDVCPLLSPDTQSVLTANRSSYERRLELKDAVNTALDKVEAKTREPRDQSSQ